MTATRQRTRIAATLAAALGLGALGLTGAGTAAAAPAHDTVSVTPHLDAGLWTAKDGAPRYRVDGIGFSDGAVKVVVRNEGGKVLWSRTVQTGYDPGLPQFTFHVGTNVRCDHRTRYVTAQDLGTGRWTERYTLNPCII